ncbi:MAG: winged helix-turn-helix domain-containing protein [Rubricoccaceae bacterium]|nr:winged helix-turn-helix domain-containing protein [Rubricoccaceae bacterium]
MRSPAFPDPDRPRRLRVGDWDVDPSAHEIARAGETVRVEPKVMALLVHLAERAGETVSRDDLLAAVWPGVVVTEDALSRAASKLRRALDDDAQAPRYVETIPKAGYRLIAPVEWGGEALAAAPATAAGRATGAAAPGGAPRLWLTLGVVALALVLLVLGVRWWAGPEAPASRPLTHLPGVETHPALSPDGRFLAFVAVPRDSAGSDLYVQGLDDPAPRRLTATPETERHPTWGPDGQIAFLRCTDLRCGLFAAPALGGRVRRLADAVVGPWGLSGTADGRRVVGVARPEPDAPYQVVLVDVKAGTTRPLTAPPPRSVGDLYPALDPAGTRVAFVRHSPDGAEDVLVQALDGSAAAVQVTHDGVPIGGLAWTPDGRGLVVASGRGGVEGLWRVPADGGEPERVPLAMAATPRRPALAPGRLVFEARTAEVNLYRLDLTREGPPQPAVVSTDASTQPAISPDGARIAFVSSRSGTPALWTARADGTDLVRLVDFEGARLGAPRWSPNGRRIAFEAQQGGTAEIYVVDAEGGAARPVTEDIGYALGPRWGPEGRFVYFGANPDGDWRVWRVPVGGDGQAPAAAGPPEPVSPPGGFVGEPTADGRALVFSRADAPGLWRRSLPDGPAARLDTTLALSDWGSWAVTDTGVFLVGRGADGTHLVRLDPTTGARETVRRDLGPLPSREPALVVSRDGRVVVLARATRVESALVLVEPFE